jgi:hypothetical protein
VETVPRAVQRPTNIRGRATLRATGSPIVSNLQRSRHWVKNSARDSALQVFVVFVSTKLARGAEMALMAAGGAVAAVEHPLVTEASAAELRDGDE